jgi:hypothetical protein
MIPEKCNTMQDAAGDQGLTRTISAVDREWRINIAVGNSKATRSGSLTNTAHLADLLAPECLNQGIQFIHTLLLAMIIKGEFYLRHLSERVGGMGGMYPTTCHPSPLFAYSMIEPP